MKSNEDTLKNFKVSFKITSEYFVPIILNEEYESFQWAKVDVVPLEKSTSKEDASLETAIDFSYDIPAKSIKEATKTSKEVVDFIINTASLHYSIGFRIVSPISLIDINTGDGLVYEWKRLTLTKEKFCTKEVDFYLPFSLKNNEHETTMSSDTILTYEKTGMFKIKEFYETIDLFKNLYVGFISDDNSKDGINFALDMLREALFLPGFDSRFLLYWRAFEKLLEDETQGSIVNEESLNKISNILKKQSEPSLSIDDTNRVMNQIKKLIIHHGQSIELKN